MRLTGYFVAGLSLLLALAPAALGKAPSAASHRGAFSVTVPASAQRSSLRADFEPRARTLTLRAEGRPDVAAHVIQLPVLPSGVARSEVVHLAAGEHALVLRFGAPDPYVLVLLAPRLGSIAALEGAVVLKGLLAQAAGSGSSLSTIDGLDGQRLVLSEGVLGEGRDAKSGVCGRSARVTRALDPQKGRFVRVAVPVLGAEERRKARKIPAHGAGNAQAEGSTDLYLGPWPSAYDTAELDLPALTDARFTASAAPYELVDVSLPRDAGVDALVVHVEPGAAADASWDLWLLTERAVLEVDTSGLRGEAAFVIELSEELRTGCLGLTVGVGTPFVEVTGRSRTQAVASVGDALRAEDGDQGARRLALLRPAVVLDLAREYSSLPPRARARAESLARLAEPSDAEAFWVRQAIQENEGERTRGRARLRQQEDGGIAALGRALRSARARDELLLAQALADFSPPAAVRPLAGRLGQRSAARRLELRKVLAGLRAEPDFLDEVARLLLDAEVPRAQKVEVVRAVAPATARLEPKARQEIVALLHSASYDEAYVLIPTALELSVATPAARDTVLGWTNGQPLDLSPRQLAALRTEILGIAKDRELSAGWLARASTELLEDPYLRVRVGAASYLEVAPAAEASRPLQERLRHDEWPSVREATLGALAALRDKLEQAPEVEAAIIRALAKDPAPSVRARAARVLDRLPRPETLEALRRSLGKDDSASVRAESARSLGLLCDHGALAALTTAARGLSRGARDEADVRLGLNAITALARLAPADLDARLAPLTAPSVPGPLRARVESAIAAGRGGCAPAQQR